MRPATVLAPCCCCESVCHLATGSCMRAAPDPVLSLVFSLMIDWSPHARRSMRALWKRRRRGRARYNKEERKKRYLEAGQAEKRAKRVKASRSED